MESKGDSTREQFEALLAKIEPLLEERDGQKVCNIKTALIFLEGCKKLFPDAIWDIGYNDWIGDGSNTMPFARAYAILDVEIRKDMSIDADADASDLPEVIRSELLRKKIMDRPDLIALFSNDPLPDLEKLIERYAQDKYDSIFINAVLEHARVNIGVYLSRILNLLDVKERLHYENDPAIHDEIRALTSGFALKTGIVLNETQILA